MSAPEIEESPDVIPKKPRRKGIYLLPNLFTTGTLFGGFYAIVMAMGGRFELACVGILIAMIADGLEPSNAAHRNQYADKVLFGFQRRLFEVVRSRHPDRNGCTAS